MFDRGILPGLHRILAATTPGACHAAIEETAQLLEDLFGFAILAAAELTPALQGLGICWQSDGLLRDNGEMLAGWFRQARHHPGRTLAFGDAAAGLVMAGGPESAAPSVALIADGTLLPPPLETAMRDVAEFSARHLYRLRQEEEIRRRRERLDADGSRDAQLIQASADLVWEADPEGRLHVLHIFHDRRDLARQIEGRFLGDIMAGLKDPHALAAAGKPVRAQRITLPGIKESLFLTACAGPDTAGAPRLHGTIASAPELAAERLTIDAGLLDTLMAARRREEQLRRETEAMMHGLRVLLSDLSFREKLEQLALHLAGTTGCDEARLVLFRPGDTPRLVMPAAMAADAKALSVIEKRGSAGHLIRLAADGSDARNLRSALGMPGGDIILIALPSAAERYYLLCRARRPLSESDHGVAERIALLLQQALLLQDDQNRMIHTAKLSALGQMSTGIAHELRQPLNAISLAAQNIELMLEMDKLSPVMLREKTGRIQAQIERACQVMDRMRRFGRKTAGDYKPAPLAGLARSARSLMDAGLATAGVSLDIDVPDELKALVDELQIEQVLVNLIQNAADALAGRKNGRIRIWSAPDPENPGMARLNVEDNGPGFSPEVVKHALDAFFTTKPEGKGTGLGLSITHSILREHGGRVLIGNGAMGGGLITLVLRRPEAQLLAFTPPLSEPAGSP